MGRQPVGQAGGQAEIRWLVPRRGRRHPELWAPGAAVVAAPPAAAAATCVARPPGGGAAVWGRLRAGWCPGSGPGGPEAGPRDAAPASRLAGGGADRRASAWHSAAGSACGVPAIPAAAARRPRRDCIPGWRCSGSGRPGYRACYRAPGATRRRIRLRAGPADGQRLGRGRPAGQQGRCHGEDEARRTSTPPSHHAASMRSGGCNRYGLELMVPTYNHHVVVWRSLSHGVFATTLRRGRPPPRLSAPAKPPAAPARRPCPPPARNS